MNFEDVEILSSAEFGSTYKGISDKYSDEDVFHVVLQPFQDTVFGNLKNGVTHAGDDSYRAYAIEYFISVILKGSYDSFLLLCSQLENCKDTELNEAVFDDFYDDGLGLFDELLRSRAKRFASSLMGMINHSIKRLSLPKHDSEYGKNLLNAVEYLNVLHHFLKHLDTEYVYQPVDVVGLNRGDSDIYNELVPTRDLIKSKRYGRSEWFDVDTNEKIYDEFQKHLKRVEREYHSQVLRDSKFEYEDELKEKVCDFIIKKYLVNLYKGL